MRTEIVVGSERNNGSKEYSRPNSVEMETKRDPDESREKGLWGMDL